MKPRYISLAQLFGPPIRFIVPLFQRPYVWDRKDQWEPLWEDLATVADRVLRAVGHGTIRGHFLGSVVLEHEVTGTGSIERRAVIDGQQRLTTIQILLKATIHAFATVAEKQSQHEREMLLKARRQVTSLVRNPEYAEGDEAYKVWPTNQDRQSFKSVMDADALAVFPAPSRMMGAHRFFMDEIVNWLLLEDSPGRRGSALAHAMMQHLHVIVLDLEDSDEPQAIFETLNTGGAPLLTVDLVKNWLLWEAQRGGKGEIDCAALYEQFWKPLDDDSGYWRKRIGAGHANRPRIDTFLLHWLTEQTRTVVTASHVYEAFLDHVAAPARATEHGTTDVASLMRNIHSAAISYRRFDEPSAGNDRFSVFLRRMKEMSVVTIYPLLMHLLSRAGSTQNDLDSCAQILESYLTRRSICDLATRGTSTTNIKLLTTIATVGPNGPAAPLIRDVLVNSRGAANLWPDDATFEASWRSRDLYAGRGARPLLILRALEEQEWRQDKLAMPVASFDWKRVQVEHIMPQSWQKHWALAPEADPADRDAAVQRIGNLTLVSDTLNPSISNGPWALKRSALADHAHLRLTSAITEQKSWGEAEIADRTGKLLDLALRIWPGPAAPLDAFGIV